MTTQEKLYTVDEFERFIVLPENRDRYFELINGEIVEKVPTQKHGKLAGVVYGEVYIFLKQNPLGHILIEARYRIPDDKHNARQPDLSFVSDVNRPLVDRGAALYMPDLAVEVQSPDDTIQSMRERAAYYLENGSRLVWLIFPDKRIVETYTAKRQDILTIEDTLDGGEVLPGFLLPVRAIFEA